jgi:hypothetical protein
MLNKRALLNGQARSEMAVVAEAEVRKEPEAFFFSVLELQQL